MQATKEVSFKISKRDSDLVNLIVQRAEKLAKAQGQKLDKLSARMDLTATHANGCPIDFKKLEAADDFNLAHDVFGIERHLDRETGQLLNCFLPRCSKPRAA